MRILIVEDDDRIAKPLAEDLRQQHHVVEIAVDGIEGWDYTRSHLKSIFSLFCFWLFAIANHKIIRKLF